MDGCNRFGKKIAIEWMAEAAPLKKATTVKKIELPIATSLYK